MKTVPAGGFPPAAGVLASLPLFWHLLIMKAFFRDGFNERVPVTSEERVLYR